MIRTLRIELRMTQFVPVAAVLTSIDLFILLAGRDRDYWVGDWHATSIAIQFPVIAMAPLMAAFAAHAGGRAHRHGFWVLEQVMPRGPQVVAAAQCSAIWAAGTAAYLVGAVTASVITWARADAGTIWPSYVLIGLLSLATYSTLGYTIGRILPARWSAPLAGLVVFVWLIIMSLSPDRIQWLGLVYGNIFVSPARQLSPVTLAASVFWGAAVILTCLAASRLTRTLHLTQRIKSLWPLVPIVISATAVTAVIPTGLVPRPASERFCLGSSPTVCTWPEHAKWAAQTAAVARRLSDATFGVYAFPAIVFEEGLAPNTAESPQLLINTFPVTDTSIVTALTRALVPSGPPICRPADQERFQRYLLVRAWLQVQGAGRVGPDVRPDAHRLSELTSLPIEKQRDWIRTNLRAVKSCSAPLPADEL